MFHSKFAPRLLAMGLLAASALSVTALAAPTAIRVDRDHDTAGASQAGSSTNNPISVDPSQASGEIEVIYQDANGVERTATISAVAAQSETYACINAGGDALRVRQGPGTSYEILCNVYDGDRFPITGKTDGWYQILCNGRTGYVSAEFVTVEDKDSVSKPDGGNGGNSSTNPLAQQIVDFALQYVGYPYVYGTAGPDTFDCSGFTYYVYAHFGYSLNRSSRDQVNNGVAVSKDQLQPGDLVFFNDPSRNKGKACSHAGIYIGNGQHVHASSSRNGGVITSDLTSGYYNTYFVGGLRLS